MYRCFFKVKIAKKKATNPIFIQRYHMQSAYLRRQDRRAEVQVLWHGYSTRWLARKFPEDAALLLSNTRDGRSLKNRGYRSKESVDRLAPDFDREARSEGFREFGL